MAPHDMPFYIVKPGETDVLMIVMGVFLILDNGDLGRTEVGHDLFPSDKLPHQRGTRNIVRVPPVGQASIVNRKLTTQVR